MYTTHDHFIQVGLQTSSQKQKIWCRDREQGVTFNSSDGCFTWQMVGEVCPSGDYTMKYDSQSLGPVQGIRLNQQWNKGPLLRHGCDVKYVVHTLHIWTSSVSPCPWLQITSRSSLFRHTRIMWGSRIHSASACGGFNSCTASNPNHNIHYLNELYIEGQHLKY